LINTQLTHTLKLQVSTTSYHKMRTYLHRLYIHLANHILLLYHWMVK